MADGLVSDLKLRYAERCCDVAAMAAAGPYRSMPAASLPSISSSVEFATPPLSTSLLLKQMLTPSSPPEPYDVPVDTAEPLRLRLLEHAGGWCRRGGQQEGLRQGQAKDQRQGQASKRRPHHHRRRSILKTCGWMCMAFGFTVVFF